ncbi:MAG TPA: hypothetical protein VHB99_16960 [Pirellulales bacterium]|nr:hypothetical protein [Pirellulales bacterium]
MTAFAKQHIRLALVALLVVGGLGAAGLAKEAKRDPRRTFWKAETGNTYAQAADGNWTETTVAGNRFHFVTAALEKDYIELLDAPRKVSIRLYADKAEIRIGDGDFAPFHKGKWEEPPKVAPAEKKQGENASAASHEPPDRRMRMIYFVPKDRQPINEYEAKIRTVMGIVDSVYQAEFRRRRWKEAKLDFELDEEDRPIVHLVRGKENAAHYSGAPNYNADRQWQTFTPEIPPEIGAPHLNLIVGFLETYDEGPARFEWPGGVALGGRFSADGGLGIFSAWLLKDDFTASSEAAQMRLFQDATPIQGRTSLGHGRPNSPRFEFIEDGMGAVVHELGHALGLPHDQRQPFSIMGNGFRQLRNNFVAGAPLDRQAAFSDDCARLLRCSRLANPTLDLADAEPPQVEFKVQDSGAGLVRLKVDAADDGGLRAVVVFDVLADSIVAGQSLSKPKWSKTVPLSLKRNSEGGVQFRVIVADNGGQTTVKSYP